MKTTPGKPPISKPLKKRKPSSKEKPFRNDPFHNPFNDVFRKDKYTIGIIDFQSTRKGRRAKRIVVAAFPEVILSNPRSGGL